jgi:hypothetical protein
MAARREAVTGSKGSCYGKHLNRVTETFRHAVIPMPWEGWVLRRK